MPGDHPQPLRGCDLTHLEANNPGWPYVYPCRDCDDPRWDEAWAAVPQQNIDIARASLVESDHGGGFWKFNPTDKQVGCHWLNVADGGKYGGKLVPFAISKGWIPATPGGNRQPAAGTVAANTNPMTTTLPGTGGAFNFNSLLNNPQNQPLLIAGLVMLALLLRK